MQKIKFFYLSHRNLFFYLTKHTTIKYIYKTEEVLLMKKNVFSEKEFEVYKKSSLVESWVGDVRSFHNYSYCTTIFISHKHDDLEKLKGIIGFLEKKYQVKCYIDGKDPTLPQITSGETAKRIKNRIDQCDKFILLASNGAIESKWCNWELGYGDCQKKLTNVAIFPVVGESELTATYKGYEYMELYSTIVYYGQWEYYTDGKVIQPGYYVSTKENESYHITPLAEWLKKNKILIGIE